MRKSIQLSWVILVLVIVVGCGPTHHNQDKRPVSIRSPKPYPPERTPVLTDKEKDVFLQAVNDMRSVTRKCGDKTYGPSPALIWSDRLYRAAVEHNHDMIQSHIVNMDHHGSGTASDYTMRIQNLDHPSYFQERIENNGYTQWRSVGENLTLGSASLDDAMRKLLESAGHCANIMDPDFTHLGMSHIHIDQDRLRYYDYWTQDFGGN